MKACRKCGETKPLEDYYAHPTSPDRRQYVCKPCQKASATAYRAANPTRRLVTARALHRKEPRRSMLSGAKRRASEQGLAFDLVLEDITIPPVCPVLGIPLHTGEGMWSTGSPSLDRLIPELGYVKGNVVVISWRANALKRDATLEELELLTAWLARHVAPSLTSRRRAAP
jgi:hypothetical protein